MKRGPDEREVEPVQQAERNIDDGSFIGNRRAPLKESPRHDNLKPPPTHRIRIIQDQGR